MRLSTYNQIIYSYIVVLLSENKFQLADDLLKMVNNFAGQFSNKLYVFS
jgi:hypothetical protein